MRSQRIDLTTVDFAQQVLISCHTAELPVPVGFCLNPAFFPVNLEKLRIRGNHFCNDGPAVHSTPAVWAAVMVTKIHGIGLSEVFHQASFFIRPGALHLMPGEAAVGTYHLNQTLAEQADK